MQDLNIRVPAKWLRRIAIAAVAAVVMIPTAVIAAGGTFVDDDTSVFESNIEWLASADVTKGCNADAMLYCPDDNVTRGQMAAFMQRFAQYLDAEDGTPAEADNASTLGGFTPTEFVSAGVVMRYGEAAVPDNGNASALATCHAGEVLIGGGGAISLFVSDVPILSSRPADSASPGTAPADGASVDSWRATAYNPAGGTGSVDVRAWAVCASSANLSTSGVSSSGPDGP